MKMWETLFSVPTEFLRYKHPRCYPQPHTPNHIPLAPPLPGVLESETLRPQVRMFPSESPVRMFPSGRKTKQEINLGFLYFWRGQRSGVKGKGKHQLTGQLGVLGHIGVIVPTSLPTTSPIHTSPQKHPVSGQGSHSQEPLLHYSSSKSEHEIFHW